jgi:hypothetical protein
MASDRADRAHVGEHVPHTPTTVRMGGAARCFCALRTLALSHFAKELFVTPHSTTDLAVTLPDDRPGMLAKAIGAVGGAGIDIEGYAEMQGTVHILSEDVSATRRALEGAGFKVIQEQHVVLVPVEDQPGAAARVFQRIAESHVNVKYSYLATGNRLVIGADNLDAVLKAVTA